MATANKNKSTPSKPSVPAKPAPGKAAPSAAKPGAYKVTTNGANTKPTPAPVTKVPENPTPIDDDGDDLDGDASDAPAVAPGAPGDKPVELSTNERYKLHLRSLSPAKRQAVLVNNLVERTKRQQDAINGWQGAEVEAVRSILTSVADGLKLAADGLAALPDDYKPRVAGGGKRASAGVELKAGDIVRVTDKRREEYDGVLEAGQDRGMNVIEVRGNKVIVMLTGQIKAMFPRGHVTIDDGSADAPESAPQTDDSTDAV